MKIILFIITLISSIIQCSSGDDLLKSAFEKSGSKYAIIIEKSKFQLRVVNRKLNLIEKYRISYGKNIDGGAKLFSGDNRTPEGLYHINEILSMDFDNNSTSFRKLKYMNSVYFSAKSGHSKFKDSKRDLGRNAYGPRYFGINYPNEEDRKKYKKYSIEGKIPLIKGKVAGIGYGIAIHGNGDVDSIGHPASSGCVRMYNNDVVDLEKYIQIKTPILIVK